MMPAQPVFRPHGFPARGLDLQKPHSPLCTGNNQAMSRVCRKDFTRLSTALCKLCPENLQPSAIQSN